MCNNTQNFCFIACYLQFPPLPNNSSVPFKLPCLDLDSDFLIRHGRDDCLPLAYRDPQRTSSYLWYACSKALTVRQNSSN